MNDKKTIEEIIAAQNKGQRRKSREEEHQIQCACVKWFNFQYSKYRGLLFAVPNGGYRTQATAGKLRAEGVVAGVSDLILMVPRWKVVDARDWFSIGLCIEMKTAKGKQSPEQKEWQKKVEEQGYRYIVCHSFDEFKKYIEWYLGKK